MRESTADNVVDRLKDSIYYGLGRIEANGAMLAVHFKELRAKADNTAAGSVLVILKGDWDGLPVIAFHQDQGLVSAMAGALNRATKGGLRWKIDEFAMREAGYDKESITAAGRELASLAGREST